jgi:hypothetical protein
VKRSFRKYLIATCTFLGGIYFFLEFVIPKFLMPETVFGVPFATFDTRISQSTILVSAMAIGLGVINLVRVHGIKIIRARPGWINSIALLAGMFLVFGIEINDFINAEERLNSLDRFQALHIYTNREAGLLQDSNGRSLITKALEDIHKDAATRGNILFNPDDQSLANGLSELIRKLKLEEPEITLNQFEETLFTLEKIAREQSGDNYKNSNARKASGFVFTALFTPLGSAMFSLLAFYVATAAYRAFRIRSIEAGIMMLTAIIVMLGQIPHGPLYISEHLPDIRTWLLLNISTPAFRAIFFGSAIAGLAMAIRMWFSLERSPLSQDTDSKE